MGHQQSATRIPAAQQPLMDTAPQEPPQENDALPDYLAQISQVQRNFLTFEDEEEAARYGFLKRENLCHILEHSWKNAPHHGGGCQRTKFCTYCKVNCDDRSYNPIMSINVSDFGVIRRALLDWLSTRGRNPGRSPTARPLCRT